jgi:hypothetical protein
MAFHLLTEEELDSIAHYYHQSTPGPWSNHYPASMNWDKDFLAKPTQSPTTKSRLDSRRRGRRISQDTTIWLDDLMKTVEDIQSSTAILPSQTDDVSSSQRNPYAGLSDKDRVRIKRRKVGKFIGLVGQETPAEEIAVRIQVSFDRAIERSREELRRNEEVMLRRRKMA